MCRYFIALAEDGLPLTITVRQALLFIKEAWEEVTQSTIANCWRHTGILPGTTASASSSTASSTTASSTTASSSAMPAEDVQQLTQLISNLPDAVSADMSAEEFINIDADLDTQQLLTDNEILELVTSEGPDAEDPEDPDDPEPEPVPPMTRKQARGGLLDALQFFEQQAGSENPTPEAIDTSATLIKQLRSMLSTMDTKFQTETKQPSIKSFFTPISPKDP